VSWAAEHPVYCARREDAGCQASHPRSRFDAIKATEQGWFHSHAEGLAYCPGHVPEWVPAWREKQAARRFEVEGTFTRLSAVLQCHGCRLAETASGDDPEAVKVLRAAAFEHGRRTGHRVTVTAAQELAVEPVGVKTPVSS
jgi:hypothetical protein